MIPNILTKIFGSRNERLLKQYAQVVQEINALEPAIAALSDDELTEQMHNDLYDGCATPAPAPCRCAISTCS